jgi:hypothetical protein
VGRQAGSTRTYLRLRLRELHAVSYVDVASFEQVERREQLNRAIETGQMRLILVAERPRHTELPIVSFTTGGATEQRGPAIGLGGYLAQVPAAQTVCAYARSRAVGQAVRMVRTVSHSHMERTATPFALWPHHPPWLPLWLFCFVRVETMRRGLADGG